MVQMGTGFSSIGRVLARDTSIARSNLDGTNIYIYIYTDLLYKHQQP